MTMNPELIKAFKNIKCHSYPALTENVWRAVAEEEKSVTRIKLYAFSALGLLSLAGLIYALQALLNEFTKSGFFEYSSLIFSNSTLALSNWKELSFSMAESLPAVSIIFTLSVLFILFVSLKHLMRQVVKSGYHYNGFRIGQLSF